MQYPRISLLFMAFLPVFAGGCASDRPPSGGKNETTPLQVLLSDPAPSSINISTKSIRLTFNHEVTGRQMLKALSITPPVGAYDITQKGKTIEVNTDKPLESERTYIVSLNKNLQDNRGHSLPFPFTMAFSTGKKIDNGIINGTVVHEDFSPAKNALLLAFAEPSQKSGKGSLMNRIPEYILQADASGGFSFRHIAAGSYRVVAIDDRNNDMQYTPGEEGVGISSMGIIRTGTSHLLFRLSRSQQNGAHPKPKPVNQMAESAETGSISGKCFAVGKSVMIEASSATALYRVPATREGNGIFYYIFQNLPPGSYTVSAYTPLGGKKRDAQQDWNPGTIVPFQPADPFAFYAEKVTVRARWTTEHIDIRIKDSL